MRIARGLLDELIAHARDEAPNECCGIVGAVGDEAVSVHRVRNEFASPLRYRLDGMESFRAFEAIEEAGQRVGIVYHSHTRSDPVPSQTDINDANPLLGDDVLYVIVGVAGDEPDVRAWRIEPRRGYEPADLSVEG